MTCILTNHAMSNYIDTPRQCEATFFFSNVGSSVCHQDIDSHKLNWRKKPKIEYTFVFE